MGEAVNINQGSDFITKNKESTFSLTFFVGMAIYLTVIVIVGFWPTYFGNLLLGHEPADFGLVEISWEVHFHVSVFMAWMALLLTQTFLVARDNTKTHTKLGKYGFLFGIILIAVGLFMTFVQIEAAVAQNLITWSEVFPGVFATNSFVGMTGFAILLGLGYYYRTLPSSHKRYMLFATIAISNAATSRWEILIGPWSNEIINLMMVGPTWAYDLYNDRRIHRATLIGTGIVGIYFLKQYLL